jgi:hypothetical protein
MSTAAPDGVLEDIVQELIGQLRHAPCGVPSASLSVPPRGSKLPAGSRAT